MRSIQLTIIINISQKRKNLQDDGIHLRNKKHPTETYERAETKTWHQKVCGKEGEKRPTGY